MRLFHQILHSRRFTAGLALTSTGILVLAVLLAATPALFSDGEGGIDPTGGDRGDSPVVGSLPCRVSPVLDFMIPPDPDEDDDDLPPPPSLPTLTLRGESGTDCSVAYASGEPFGLINARSGWSAFGVQRPATILVSRVGAAGGEVSLWQYLPDGYVGGTLEVQSFLGSRTIILADNATRLPLRAIALNSAAAGAATVRMHPAPGHEALPVKTLGIVLTPTFVVLEYER